MNRLQVLIGFLIIELFSCNLSSSEKSTAINKDDVLIEKRDTQNFYIDESSIRVDFLNIDTIEIDGYSIDNNLLDCGDLERYCQIEYRGLISYEKKWFTNVKRSETIVIHLATDKFRYEIYHFVNKNVPKDLIHYMELHTKNGQIAAKNLKETEFIGLVEQGIVTEDINFVSEKGIEIGLSKDRCLEIYGEPQYIEKIEGIDQYYWKLHGDSYTNTYWKFEKKSFVYGDEKPEKRIGNKSLGQEILMFFENDNLIGMILHNAMP